MPADILPNLQIRPLARRRPLPPVRAADGMATRTSLPGGVGGHGRAGDHTTGGRRGKALSVERRISTLNLERWGL